MQSVNAAEVIDRGKIGSIKAIMEEVSGRYCQVVILVLFLFVEGQIFKYGETSTLKSLPVVINTWPFTNATAEGRIWKRLKNTIDKLNYSSTISLLYNWSSDPLRRLAELKSKSKIKNQIWVIQRILAILKTFQVFIVIICHHQTRPHLTPHHWQSNRHRWRFDSGVMFILPMKLTSNESKLLLVYFKIRRMNKYGKRNSNFLSIVPNMEH